MTETPAAAVAEVAAPAAAETPVVETPAPAAAEAPAAEVAPTLLGGAEPAKPPETPAAEPASGEGEKPAPEAPAEGEGSQSEQAPLPVYEPFTLPEGFTADGERLGQFTSLLAELEVSKGDHAKAQEIGQKLVDYHIAEINALQERSQTAFQNEMGKIREEWAAATKAHPEIGGNRLDTSLQAASRFIREIGGSGEQQTEFRQLLEDTGLGSHPVMLGFLARGMNALGEGKQFAAPAPAAQAKSRAQKMYGGK